MSISEFENAKEPYLDEDHLYNKYEMMKMANDRNMKEKIEAQAEITKLKQAYDVLKKACEDVDKYQYQITQMTVLNQVKLIARRALQQAKEILKNV